MVRRENRKVNSRPQAAANRSGRRVPSPWSSDSLRPDASPAAFTGTAHCDGSDVHVSRSRDVFVLAKGTVSSVDRATSTTRRLVGRVTLRLTGMSIGNGALHHPCWAAV